MPKSGLIFGNVNSNKTATNIKSLKKIEGDFKRNCLVGFNATLKSVDFLNDKISIDEQ
jgi:hypothetical protein